MVYDLTNANLTELTYNGSDITRLFYNGVKVWNKLKTTSWTTSWTTSVTTSVTTSATTSTSWQVTTSFNTSQATTTTWNTSQSTTTTWNTSRATTTSWNTSQSTTTTWNTSIATTTSWTTSVTTGVTTGVTTSQSTTTSWTTSWSTYVYDGTWWYFDSSLEGWDATWAVYGSNTVASGLGYIGNSRVQFDLNNYGNFFDGKGYAANWGVSLYRNFTTVVPSFNSNYTHIIFDIYSDIQILLTQVYADNDAFSIYVGVAGFGEKYCTFTRNMLGTIFNTWNKGIYYTGGYTGRNGWCTLDFVIAANEWNTLDANQNQNYINISYVGTAVGAGRTTNNVYIDNVRITGVIGAY